MKGSKYLKERKNIKRFFRWLRLKIYFGLLKSGEHRVRMPKKMTESEKTVSSIFLGILLSAGSKLYYDIQTGECYLKSEDGSLYLFLEALNIKVINSVYGYDVQISAELENYLTDRFRREMAIRRRSFKKEAMSKVEHSLHNTLNKLNVERHARVS